MATEKQTLLFELRLDEADIEKRLIENRKRADEVRASIAALKKQYKDGAVGVDEYQRQLLALEKQQKQATTQIREDSKTLEQNEKVRQSAKGSVDQLRANLSLMAQQWTKLSKEQRENTDEGKALTQSLKEQADALNETKKGAGDYTSNIGRYRESIEPLIQELVKLEEYQKLERQVIGFQVAINKSAQESGQSFEEVQNKVKSYGGAIRGTVAEVVKLEKAQETLEEGSDAYEKIGFKIGALNKKISETPKEAKKASESLQEVDQVFTGGAISGFKEKVTGAIQGLNGMKVGLTGIKAALAASGIGLLVIILGAVISFLTKSQEGMDFLARKMAFLGGLVKPLERSVISLGKWLIDAFTSPKKALKELGDFIVENLINRFKAFGVILQAIRNRDLTALTNGFLQLGTGVENVTGKIDAMSQSAINAARAAEGLVKAQQALREAELGAQVAAAKNITAIERYKKLAEDVTKGTGVRLSAAQKAYDLEQQGLRNNISLQQRKIGLLQQEAKQNNNNFESRKAIAEAQVELATMEADSLGKQTELQNQLNSIKQEAADKAKGARQKELQDALTLAQLELEIARQTGKETLRLEETVLQKQFAIDTEGLNKKSKLYLLYEAKLQADMAKLRIDKQAEALKLESDTRIAGIEAQLAIVKTGSAQELRLIQERIRAKAEQDRKAAETEIQDLKLRAATIRKIDAEAKRDQRNAEIQFVESQTQLAQDEADRRKQIAKNLTDRLKDEISRRRMAQIDTELSGVQAGTKKELNLRLQALRAQRDQELAQTGLLEEEKAAIRARYARQEKDLQTQFFQEQFNRIAETASQITAAQSKIVEASYTSQIAALDKQQQVATQSAGLSADMRAKIEEDFAKRREEIEREAAKKRKKIASAENFINTAKAITAAFSNPFPINLIQAALAAVMGAKQQQVIDAQTFAAGGVGYVSDRRGSYVTGPGTGKSDSIHARISHGESVINAESTRKFYPVLSWINEQGGGRRFPNLSAQVPRVSPSMPRTYAFGGVPTGSGSDYGQMKRAFSEALREMPSPVVSVVDVIDKSSSYQSAEVYADV